MRVILGFLVVALALSQDLQLERVLTTPVCTPAKCGDYGVCFPKVGCVCQANRAGENCDVNVCQTSGGTCLDVIPPQVQAPPTSEISCDETNLSPTAEGTGAPFLNDNCPVSRLQLKISNKVSRRPYSSCPNAAVITRTFNVSDACGNWAADDQRILVDDKKAPFVSVKLVPLPANVRSVLSGTNNGNSHNMNGGPSGALGSLLSGRFGSVSNHMNMNPPNQVELRPFSSDSMMGSSVFQSVQRTGTDGVAACNPPSVRSFVVACNISDSCSSRSDLTVQARLKLVRVTNRNAFTLASNRDGKFMMSNRDGPLGGGLHSSSSSSGSNVLDQLASLLGNTASSTSFGSLGSVECSTAVEYVDVSCGDTVTFENEREDSCLDTNFQAGTPFMHVKPMAEDDFEGGRFAVDSVLASHGMKGHSLRASTVSVRGTSLTLQVRVADECDNRAEDVFAASDARDDNIAGRDCPAISPALASVSSSNNKMSTGGPLGTGGPLSDLFSKFN